MRISVTRQNHSVDLSVSGLAADANLADLLQAVSPTTSRFHIDDLAFPLDAPASDVRHGSQVVVDGSAKPAPIQEVANLHAVSGPSAGRTWKLRPGRYQLGPSTDIPLSGLDTTVTINPEGSALWGNVDFPDGVLRVGLHRLRISLPPGDTTPHPPGSHSFFNRPPRHLLHTKRHPLVVPKRDAVNGKSRRISAIMIVLPIITGVAMALFFGRMMFLAFAALGPITMIGSAIDDRRRRKKERRESAEKFDRDLIAFGGALERQAAIATIEAYATNPSCSELLLHARGRTQRLWERRSQHQDFLYATVGYGPAPWTPALDAPGDPEAEVDEVIHRFSALADGPVVMSLAPGRVLGIAGSRHRAQALASDIVCQLAVAHGPVDLRIAILTDAPEIWDWAKWLPHMLMNQGSDLRLIATDSRETAALLGSLRTGQDPGHVTLLVVDHRTLDDDELKTIRECLSGIAKPTSGIYVVEKPKDLPAACTEVVDLTKRPAFRRPRAGTVIDPFDPVGIGPQVARAISMALAPLQDPEAAVMGSGLPDTVRLLDLLDLADPTADDIEQRWSSGGHVPRVAAPVGLTEAGVFSIDLVNDGPHGLMAGTTGSGKSEFLRTLVVSLSVNVSPDYLTFVLIDYKGGAAFDVCADLPHVVGMVTDLDECLGRRALLSLDAELRYREERLRDAGSSDIHDYWTKRSKHPLPRLVVVVDEFATLAKELPDFIDALVDIAQRGRSLGVHLLLATQRPAGVIKDSIRANTNLRISLRVQTVADSKDVLNSDEASTLPRSKPGRGYARLGPGDLAAFQTALSSTSTAAAEDAVVVRPFVFAMAQPQAPLAPLISTGSQGDSDLARLVATIREAFQRRGAEAPRRPWTQPLPTSLAWSDLPPAPDPLSPCLGIVDRPSKQCQVAWCWVPHDDGNLLLVGSAGWGPTDALLAVANGLASANDPDQVHLYGIDHGGGRLTQLKILPHVGAIVAAGDTERQMRLLRHLRDEIDRRRGSTGSATTVLLLDGLAGFRAAFDDQALVSYRDLLHEIAANGPERGVFVVATADQNRVVPSALAGAMATRLAFALADRLEYGMLGVKGTVADLPRCRAIDPNTQEHVQVASVTRGDSAEVTKTASTATLTPEPIRSLSKNVTITDIIDAGSVTEEVWKLPIGVEDTSLLAATVSVYPGDHLMIAGPVRSGRTTALDSLATIIHKLSSEIRIVAICPRPSELRLNPAIDEVLNSVQDLGPLETSAVRTLVLVDDAEDVDDDGMLAEIVETRRDGFVIVAAARTDALRGAHRHWTRSIRAGRRGLILRPFDAGDGDVLGVRLPRTTRPIDVPGRGYLVEHGTTSLVQIARA